MTVLSRLFGSDGGCDHESIVYEPGRCIRDDVHLEEGQVVLMSYQPYYRHCEDCGDTFYSTRHTADGRETPLGESIKRTPIPFHVTSEFLRDHHRTTEPYQ